MAGDILNIIQSWVLMLLIYFSGHNAGATGTIGQFIKYYEGLTYDRQALHQSHQRVKREVLSHNQQLQLNFTAFRRDFRLLLSQDSEGFADNFKVDLGSRDRAVDLSHVFSGKLEGLSVAVGSPIVR